MNYSKLDYIRWMSCILLLLLVAITTEAASLWQLPKQEQVYKDLGSCRQATQDKEAATLSCLVKSLSLWTDESGYQARRNRREEQRNQPDEWALRAYRCATSGRFGHWFRDFMKPKGEVN
ncbi:hypothetical protein KR059_007236 [Drosophila kikkawai]|nr:hypothetical protein KR059_007236 [Drosophila kikkawai]